MLDHFSSYKPLSIITETGQVVSPNHYGRDSYGLATNQGNLPNVEWLISQDYFANIFDDWSFRGDVSTPYIQQALAADPDHDFLTDPNAPVPDGGLASSVITKYETLSGLTHNGLLNSDDLLVAGVMAEIQPQWERMMIDSVIQAEMSSANAELVDSLYHNGGRDEVAHLLDDQSYYSSSVLFQYAQSDVFLNLTEQYQTKFVSMSIANQFELVFITEDQREAFIDENTGQYESAYSSLSSYNTELRADKENVDVPALLTRFEAHLAETGIDYVEKFNATYQTQTQQLDFSSVKNQLSGIFQLYTGVLDRTPDKGGFEYWLKDQSNGATLEEIALGFVWSEEFLSQTGSEAPTFEQVLTTLYNVVLDRDPDQEGYDWWLNQYETGQATLGNVVTGFTWSEEYSNNIDATKHAWFATTYGPNLVDLDWEDVGFTDNQIQSIEVIGSYDPNLDLGYSGINI